MLGVAAADLSTDRGRTSSNLVTIGQLGVLASDAISGGLNRWADDERIAADLAAGRQTAVVFLDVDDFKQINDRFGHAAGDELLRTVANRIRRSIRPQDRVGRLGGDEFLVVCVGLANRAEADEIASRVCAAIREPLTLGTETIQPSASAGIACDLADSVELVADADQEMYRMKRARRDIQHVATT